MVCTKNKNGPPARLIVVLFLPWTPPWQTNSTDHDLEDSVGLSAAPITTQSERPLYYMLFLCTTPVNYTYLIKVEKK